MADVALTTAPVFNHWRFSLLLRKALNTNYARPGSLGHRQQTFRQQGRTLNVQVTFKF